MKDLQRSPRLIKAKEAACYIGVSVWKLRNMTQKGEVPVIIGDGTCPWRYDIRDLDSYIDRNKLTL